LIRTKALHVMADRYGLKYVPLPGGPSRGFRIFAGWKYCPQIVKDIFETMDDHGGFDDVSEIVKASGLAIPHQAVIASKETKLKYYAQQANAQQFEDGFRGQNKGVPFAALSWVENDDDTKTHHFIIVLSLPARLTGRVEFKTRKAVWPANSDSARKDSVALVSKDFSRNFEVRASDQMEARLVFDPAVIARLTDFAQSKTAASAGGEKVKIRGAAFDTHLVVDFMGEKRFDLIDLISGEWDEARISQTFADVRDMLNMAEGIASVFDARSSEQPCPAMGKSAA
jgi:hypothetical protein